MFLSLTSVSPQVQVQLNKQKNKKKASGQMYGKTQMEDLPQMSLYINNSHLSVVQFGVWSIYSGVMFMLLPDKWKKKSQKDLFKLVETILCMVGPVFADLGLS